MGVAPSRRVAQVHKCFVAALRYRRSPVQAGQRRHSRQDKTNCAAPDPAAMGTWKFFRASVDGRPVFKKEFDKLPDQARAALIVLMQRYLVGDLAAGSIKPIRGDILELRWHEANNHFRVLFFRWGQHPVALTAFYKNQQKTPKTKIETALDRQKIWKKSLRRHPTDLNNAQPLLRG